MDGIFPCAALPGDTLPLLAQQFNTTLDALKKFNQGLNPEHIPAGQIVWIPGPQPHCISEAELKLHDQMRLLWGQHSEWTRMAIMGIVEHLPDADFISARLLRNPDDFAEALRPFYGRENAAEVARLIRDHLVIAAQLVTAAAAGNSAEAVRLEKLWYANADAWADFFNQLNPFWPANILRPMLHEHLVLVKAEAVDLINKNYAASIAAFDKNELHVLEIADFMSGGIIRQFPDLFYV